MATKKYKETVASVIALAVGAFLLGRVKNSKNSIGAIPTSILIDGNFAITKEIEQYLDKTDYIDKVVDNHDKDIFSDSLHRTTVYDFSTLKSAKENLLYAMSLVPSKYKVIKYENKKKSLIEYYINQDNIPIGKGGKWTHVVLVKGGVIRF